MAEREVLLSPEGKKSLEEELNYLKLVRRKEVAERIKAAREFGDLSENAEYADAKNEQAFVEGRIMALEKMLRHAKVVQDGERNPDVVTIGCTVKVSRRPGAPRTEEGGHRLGDGAGRDVQVRGALDPGVDRRAAYPDPGYPLPEN